jgi:hypothetical protein
LCQLAVLSSEQNLFPTPQLTAKLLISSRLRRLALQRSSLLLHLEHDVFDSGQVLLGRLELQFGCSPPRLVLRDPGRFFNQLSTIGWT